MRVHFATRLEISSDNNVQPYVDIIYTMSYCQVWTELRREIAVSQGRQRWTDGVQRRR
jgi:hypothetical protein